MLRVIIIDINPGEIQHLAASVSAALPDTRIIASTTNCKEGLRYIEDYRPDMVFLNITMMEEAFFVVLKHISWSGYFLVYTAPDARYAMKALRNNAFDYIVKPESESSLMELGARIDKSNQQLLRKVHYAAPGQLRKIPIHANKENVLYESTSNIVRLTADSNYTQIMLTDKRMFLVSKTLKFYETLLCAREQEFMRVHHSYIINLNYVSRYLKEEQGVIVMKDDFMVPLSKNKRHDFLAWLRTA